MNLALLASMASGTPSDVGTRESVGVGSALVRSAGGVQLKNE